jgi:hypothetical protein
LSVVGGRWSVVGGRWSVVGGRWSVERDQFPTNRPHDRVGVFRYRRENDTASMRSPFGGAKIG